MEKEKFTSQTVVSIFKICGNYKQVPFSGLRQELVNVLRQCTKITGETV